MNLIEIPRIQSLADGHTSSLKTDLVLRFVLTLRIEPIFTYNKYY